MEVIVVLMQIFINTMRMKGTIAADLTTAELRTIMIANKHMKMKVMIDRILLGRTFAVEVIAIRYHTAPVALVAGKGVTLDRSNRGIIPLRLFTHMSTEIDSGGTDMEKIMDTDVAVMVAVAVGVTAVSSAETARVQVATVKRQMNRLLNSLSGRGDSGEKSASS